MTLKKTGFVLVWCDKYDLYSEKELDVNFLKMIFLYRPNVLAILTVVFLSWNISRSNFFLHWKITVLFLY